MGVSQDRMLRAKTISYPCWAELQEAVEFVEGKGEVVSQLFKGTDMRDSGTGEDS